MFFKQLFDPASSTLTYLIADDASHEAVLIDPVVEQVERNAGLPVVRGAPVGAVIERESR
jgi:hypothetical protein